MLDLFEALRRRIINLDVTVREEFKKLYIAYKTTTNFVDIIPQKSRLLLSLNITYEEVDNPKSLSIKDVSGQGRWGNGDIEVGISSLNEIDSVMGLIRQAFENCRDDEGE